MELTKNKKIGLLIISIGLLIAYIIYSFNKALTGVVFMSQCALDTCPHEAALKFQTNVSIVILIVVIAAGIIFMFLKEKPAQVKKENIEITKTLNAEEKAIYYIAAKEGSVFQADLVEKSGFDKVKVTRILDKLEGKGLIERKRRGMTNIVILKQ